MATMLNMIQSMSNTAEDYRLAVEYRFNRFLANYFNNDLKMADMFVSFVVTFGMYWVVGLLYTLVDVYQKPKFLLRYKIQPTSQVSKTNLKKLLPQVLFNQIIGMGMGLMFIAIRYTYLFPKLEVPSLTRFIYEIIMFMLIREVFFYYSHRLLHHPSLYRHIHKRHHEWQTPIAIAAIYCHPLEHVVSNVFPVLIGPLVMQSNALTFYLWEVYFILLTLNDHCGYHFPLCSSPIYHDYHHWKFNVNYGILGIFDWFHGTDKSFRKTKYYKMDRIYFSLFPPKDITETKFE